MRSKYWSALVRTEHHGEVDSQCLRPTLASYNASCLPADVISGLYTILTAGMSRAGI